MNINNFDYISFDIFDTLLSRRIAKPSDLFNILEGIISSDLEWIIYPELIDNFANWRILAEKKARELQCQKLHLEPEILFDDIYKQLKIIYPKISDEYIKKLQELEFFLEKRILFKNKKGEELFLQAKKKNKTIIIISDMYYDSHQLSLLLQECGYNLENTYIFSSGEIKLSKATGSLYGYIADKLSISNNERWLHIGDNKYSDINRAKQHRIRTLHANWSTCYNDIYGHIFLRDRIAFAFINYLKLPQSRQFYNDQDSLESIGFKYFGPLILGYISWLISTAQKNGAEKLIFLARDAHLIQKIFNKFYREKHKDIAQQYLYVSRASVYKLGIVEWPINKVWAYFSGKNRKSIRSILSRFDLEEQDYITEMYDLGFCSPDYIPSKEEEYNIFLLFNKLYNKILIKNKEYRNKFISYIKDSCKGFKKIAIVDIGWAGNIQNSIVKAIAEEHINTELFGLYLATFSHSKENLSPMNNMFSWLINFGNPIEKQTIITSGGVELLELALADNTGSTKGYKLDEAGNIIPILEDISIDEKDYLESAQRIQGGILKFFEFISPIINILPESMLSSIFLAEPFLKLVTNPNFLEIEALSDITHSESAGSNDKRLKLAPKINLFHRFMKDNIFHKYYEESYWKRAYVIRNRRAFWKNKKEG